VGIAALAAVKVKQQATEGNMPPMWHLFNGRHADNKPS
jgi:hypothetical protein